MYGRVKDNKPSTNAQMMNPLPKSTGAYYSTAQKRDQALKMTEITDIRDHIKLAFMGEVLCETT